MYVVNKLRPSRVGAYSWSRYSKYRWHREPLPKPEAIPAAAPNPTKLLQRQTMRSVNRNR